jgi:hypothetical protein
MDKAIALFVAFSKTIAPYLVAIAIPSLVAALANKPKYSGVASFLVKLARVLGVLTHNDEPGTLKAPLGLDVVAKGAWSAGKAFLAAFKAGPAVALILAVALTSSGCAAFQRWEANNPKSARALKCGEDAVIAGVETVLPDVLMALAGGSPNWGALGSLEAAHGVDAVGCAVQQVMAQAEQSSGASAAVTGMRARVSTNAHAYLKARKIK